MSTKLFSAASVEKELASSMKKELISNTFEKRLSIEKIDKAADFINTAAELLEDVGFKVEANLLVNVLVRLANEDAGVDSNDSQGFHQEDQEDLEVDLPEEIVMDPLEQEIDIEPASSELGKHPLSVDFKTDKIFEKPEVLEFRSVAEKIAAKLSKKKV